MPTFISKLANWLEQLDPYYTQRIILRKGLFIATILTLVNLLAKPDVFAAYGMPHVFIAAIYEQQNFNTFHQKDLALILAYLIAAIGSACFYLLFPFKFWLIFFALAHLGSLYYLSDKFFPKFKSWIMPTIGVAALNMPLIPAANLQNALDMFFCVILAGSVCLFGYKLHPNLYHQVWYRAFKYYITNVRYELMQTLNHAPCDNFSLTAGHLNIIRNFRRLLPSHSLRHAYRITLASRNLHIALNHIYLSQATPLPWLTEFHLQLQQFEDAVRNKHSCNLPLQLPQTNDFTHQYLLLRLKHAIQSWNQLCGYL